MKHIHPTIIHAYADGEAIQCRQRTTADNAPWEDIANPSWLEDFEYRVKPVTVHALSDDVSIALVLKVGQLTKANAYLHNEIEHLKQQNEHLQWMLDTAQACHIRTQEQLGALREADASADADAQVFGADVIISIQFPPQEKL